MNDESRKPPATAEAAMARLRDGNRHFVENVRSVEAMLSLSARAKLVDGQHPFAIVLSCSDSRVPAEIIFDCGLGDLFVVRVAGNVVAPSLVGSVEYAATTFGTSLVVVMGHTCCGAIKATLDVLRNGDRPVSDNVRDLVERVTPAAAEFATSSLPEAEIVKRVTRANIRVSASHLRYGSKLLEKLVHEGKLAIVGAEASLETGFVDFFDSDL